MKNGTVLKDIFAKSIDELQLLNEGVVNVNDSLDSEALKVLEFEVRTFVCQGHYKAGLETILQNFLTNVDRPEQKAVWISGFYGSGKSHLAKMLRALWVNQELSGGRKALDLVQLPGDISALFRELNTLGRQRGGLHSLSGTLKSGAGDKVRLTTLGFLFHSLGLPEKVNLARFCLWMKRKNVFDQVKASIESTGESWLTAVGNLFVDEVLHSAVLKALPTSFSNEEEVRTLLSQEFARVTDVTNQEMVDLFKQSLAPNNAQFPLTLVVLDEVQQFIGDNESLSMAVQELVETLSKAFQGRILFIGTGQNALAANSLLQKLMGRFTVQVLLADTDVDTVVRENILKKKATAEPGIRALIDAHRGEIDRHLTGTPLSGQNHKDDQQWAVPDYPVLPVRRRFWDLALREADRTGTSIQLRNQLRMVYEAVKDSQRQELGYIVPGDYLYEQNATTLLQTQVLSRELQDLITRHKESDDPDQQLKGRILSLCFLLGKINEGKGKDVIPCVEKTLEDLLITDLRQAEVLRQKVAGLCATLVKDGHLLQTPQGFSVQTREGQKWTQEYRRFVSDLNNKPEEVYQLRRERLNAFLSTRLSSFSIPQGATKTTRTFATTFATAAPGLDEPVIWVRNGWDNEEEGVLRDVRKAGNESAWIVVFLPKRSEDEVKRSLVEFKAASQTLDFFGGAGTGAEVLQAQEAMRTTKNNAEDRLKQLWSEVVGEAKVWVGGGEEITSGLELSAKVKDGATKILDRIYPEFSKADSARWPEVLAEAKKKSVRGLEKIGWSGAAESHPVCAEILRRTRAPIVWGDLASNLQRSPFGWDIEAIEASLYVLWVMQMVSVKRTGGQAVDILDLQRKDLRTLYVSALTIVLTQADKIKLKSLYQEVGISVTSGQEVDRLGELWERATALRNEAGGVAPWPAAPSPVWFQALDGQTGNELAKGLADDRDAVQADLKAWKDLKDKKAQRLVQWEQLLLLLALVPAADTQELRTEVEALKTQRSLLNDPDPLPALIRQLSDWAHGVLAQAWSDYQKAFELAQRTLDSDALWQRLPEGDQKALKAQRSFVLAEQPKSGTTAQIIESLRSASLDSWKERTFAWDSKVSQLRQDAATKLEPAVKRVTVSRPSQALKTENDIDRWLAEVKTRLVEELKNGPVLPQ
jgi:hypothetical protein